MAGLPPTILTGDGEALDLSTCVLCRSSGSSDWMQFGQDLAQCRSVDQLEVIDDSSTLNKVRSEQLDKRKTGRITKLSAFKTFYFIGGASISIDKLDESSHRDLI